MAKRVGYKLTENQTEYRTSENLHFKTNECMFLHLEDECDKISDLLQKQQTALLTYKNENTKSKINKQSFNCDDAKSIKKQKSIL